jgi:1,4-dihydroxy-2-naphthoyl-CoA hydrolase
MAAAGKVAGKVAKKVSGKVSKAVAKDVAKVVATVTTKDVAKKVATKGTQRGAGAAANASPSRTRRAKAVPFRKNGIEGVQLIMGGQPARRLDVQLVSATRTKIVARMPIRGLHMNRGQRVNGGVLMAFADLLGAAGTVMNLEPGWRTTTLESKTNFFAAGQPPVLLAVSTPLHVGRSTNVWQTRITNEDGRLVALVTQTQIVLPPPVVR